VHGAAKLKMIKDVGRKLMPILKKTQHSACHIVSAMPVLKKSSLKSIEILIKLINSGFDIELINNTHNNFTLPVMASFGAGKVEHFSEVFEEHA